MKHQTHLITFDREFRQLCQVLQQELQKDAPLPLIVNGLNYMAADSFSAEVIALAKQTQNAPSLVLVPNGAEGRWLCDSLQNAGLTALYYPYRDFVFDYISSSHDIERERLFVLSAILSGKVDAVVTTPSAALQMTMPQATLKNATLSLSPETVIAPKDLAKRLEQMGYVAVDTVESHGQFARRGGIVDVYSPGAEPVRIEFFGDEVDRMGHFDPETQRATDPCESLFVLPAREVLMGEETASLLLQKIKQQTKKTEDPDALRALGRETAALEGGTDLYNRDKYIHLIYPEDATLLSYFTKTTAVLYLSSSEAEERRTADEKIQNEIVTSFIEKGLINGKHALYQQDGSYLTAFLGRHVPLYVNQFAGVSMSMRCAGLFGFRCRQTVSYRDNFRQLCEDLRDLIKTGYRTLILCPTEPEVDSLCKALSEIDIPATKVPEDYEISEATLPPGSVRVGVGTCRGGFDLPNPRVAQLTMGDDKTSRLRKKSTGRKQKHADAGEAIRSYVDLKVGDFIVHQTYGIGRFTGIQNTTVDGVSKDYITIQYQGTDQLLVPCEKLDLITKYIGAGADDGTVKLSKMGGAEWHKARTRAKGAAKELAKELIALYAARQKLSGYAFPPDSDLEKEFEGAFEFVETDPQLVATDDIKKDMMKPAPMDRLLCGDVGFGKTEVALRAAFKAICAGKQVALLVPTTILAMQHYQTALSRMRGFPVNVEMLSRLRSAGEQTRILRRLKRGDIDLLVGTHSLLGKKVEWRDLGLLIVDEEQRFGVAQKERLKQMAEGVDVLTLTATPIPRTLHMAMSGIRDMSILDEAPEDRFPVQTFVMEHDEGLILEAMRKELGRGGQVLYLHNRTDTISVVAAKIAQSIPEASVAWAHGQMDKEELEQIWQALVRGDINILVCTTIIETGVDLPNANTLIIEDAHRMGLSQLHQLRGRVGRSGRRAYAYFTFRPGMTLSDVAQKRLEAIREFTEFGAGFRVAMRDLEIRGAGNLLGAEQHGNIDSVGYDLYIRLLQEAILEEQGKAPPPVFECSVDIHADALIPERYIQSASHRMDMYKKISHIQSGRDRMDILDEFCDRFGEPPAPVVRLLYVSLIRALGAYSHISKVEQRGGEMRFVCEKIRLDIWSELFATDSRLRIAPGNSPVVLMKLSRGQDPAEVTADLLVRYVELLKEDEQNEQNENSQK